MTISAGAQLEPPRRWAMPQLAWPVLALLAIVAVNYSIYSNFYIDEGKLRGSLIDVIDNATPVMLVSLGMTLVIATGGIDLSVGAIMAIAGTVAAVLMRDGTSVPVAIAAALGAGLVAGAWNGMLVALVRVQPLVATLVLMVAGRGVAQLLSDGQKVPIRGVPAFSYIGNGFVFGLPFAMWMALAMLLITVLLTRRTAAGLFVEAVGDNPTAARFAGVHEPGVKFAAYCFSGLCSAIAGLLYVSNYSEADTNNAGLYIELDAILAVVIGGTALSGGRFSLVGSIIGALIVQAIHTTILSRSVKPEWSQVVKAVVVVAVALLQSPRFIALVSSPFRRRRGAAA